MLHGQVVDTTEASLSHSQPPSRVLDIYELKLQTYTVEQLLKSLLLG